MKEPLRRSKVEELVAELRQKVPRIVGKLEARKVDGIRFVVFEAWRSQERQNWLFRSPERGGKHLTDKDGYLLIGKHQRGEAVDIAALTQDGHFAPDKHSAWLAIAEAGEAEGLKSGKTWGDWPHLETKRRVT